MESGSSLRTFLIAFELWIIQGGSTSTITTAVGVVTEVVETALPIVDDAVVNLEGCSKQFALATRESHPDIGLSLEEVIAKYGYPVKRYNVVTEDGYILKVFRIPYSPKSPLVAGQRKKAIYLNHGLLSNAQQWLLQYRDRNLGFMLADAGFDVFLSNCRGNRFSNGHVNLTQSDPGYWDFSWDDMGRYDVPAVMDLITNVTGNEKMYYAGHSMGTTQYFVAMSERPELNSRIHTGFLLAPIAFLSHSTNVIRLLAPLTYNLRLGGGIDASEQLRKYTGLPLGHICAPLALSCGACGNLNFLLHGYDGSQTNYTNLPLQLSVFPDTASIMTMVHYAQVMRNGKFGKFDFGTPSANAARYGGLTSPPEYDLVQVTVRAGVLVRDNHVRGLTNLAVAVWRVTFRHGLTTLYAVSDG